MIRFISDEADLVGAGYGVRSAPLPPPLPPRAAGTHGLYANTRPAASVRKPSGAVGGTRSRRAVGGGGGGGRKTARNRNRERYAAKSEQKKPTGSTKKNDRRNGSSVAGRKMREQKKKNDSERTEHGVW